MLKEQYPSKHESLLFSELKSKQKLPLSPLQTNKIMSRKKIKKVSQQIDPYDVLNSKIKLTAHELVQLIHEVNPTGKMLGNKQTSELYQLKSHLQSHLILQYPDSLTVEPESLENFELIKINLKFYNENACHALLSELDDDARSWAQRAIDDAITQKSSQNNSQNSSQKQVSPEKESHQSKLQGSVFQDESSPAKQNLSESALIDAGHQALEHYDYATCEACFRQAFSQSKASLFATLSLFHFLIDQLASYSEVLELATKLSKKAAKNDEVKVLVALSRVHSQEIQQALAEIESISHPGTAEIYLLAAQYFVEKQDIQQAVQLLNQINPDHPSLLDHDIGSLKSKIKNKQISQIKPIESTMLEALHQGDAKSALKLAHEVLAQWPQNSHARKIIKEHKLNEKKQQLDQLKQKAEQARQQENYQQEVELLIQCTQQAETDKTLHKRLEQAKSQLKQQSKNNETQQFVQLWEKIILAENLSSALSLTLTQYLKLSPDQRQSVQRKLNHPVLNWSEQILNSKLKAKPEKILKAILALLVAKNEIEQSNDPDKIIADLKPHMSILKILTEATQCISQAKALSHSIKSSQMKNQLQQVEHLLASENFQQSKQCIDRINPDFLDEKELSRFHQLRSKVSQLESIHILEHQYFLADKEQDHFAARKLASRLNEALEQKTQNPWPEKINEQRNQIIHKWKLSETEIVHTNHYFENAIYKNTQAFFDERSILTSDNTLILVSQYGQWICLCFFSTISQTLSKTVLLRTPEPCYISDVKKHENTLWITTMENQLIELSLEPLDLICCYDFHSHLKKELHTEQAVIFPKERIFMFYQAQHHSMDEYYDFINIDNNRRIRRTRARGFTMTTCNNKQCYIGTQRDNEFSMMLYNTNGQVERVFQFKQALSIEQFTPVINSNDFIFLYYYSEDNNFGLEGFASSELAPLADEMSTLYIGIYNEETGEMQSVSLPDSNAEMQSYLVYSSSADRYFIFYYGDFSDGSEIRLSAIKLHDEELHIMYHVEPPNKEMALIQSEYNEQVLALYSENNQLHWLTLDAQKPNFPKKEKTHSLSFAHLPNFEHSNFCQGADDTPDFSTPVDINKLKQLSLIEITRLLKQEKKKNDPDLIVDYIIKLKSSYRYDEIEQLEQWLIKHHPEHPHVLLLRATTAQEEGHWQEMVQLLEKVPLDIITGEKTSHICHLLGIGYYRTGQIRASLQIWEKGNRYTDSKCQLSSYIAYASLSLMSKNERLKTSFTTDIEQLVADTFNLYETLDEQLQQRDWQGAIDSIESSQLQFNQEIQFLARYVTAYINLPAKPGESQWVYKIISLGNFISQCDNIRLLSPSNSPMPPTIKQYTEQELSDIEHKASSWLENSTITDNI